jgi:hypothetical protein
MVTPEIFSDKIFYYKSAIKDTQELIYLIESTNDTLSEQSLISNWHAWTASSGSYIFGQRKTTDASVYDLAPKPVKEAYDILNNALRSYGKDYADKVGVDLGTQMPISISKYFTGASMGPHTDSSPNPTTEHISAVIYLNDNYSGGEINFPNQEVKIKPTSGSIVIFPSTPPFYHESLPIKNGMKYMSPAFWHLFR